jgi:Tripartite tricarboxylate transporter family receptor
MKLPRRKFLHLAAGAAALPVFPRAVGAQTYPTRPVTIIVPFAAGGGTDVSARIVGDYMSRSLGQQFIIENVPGAGGSTPCKANCPGRGCHTTRLRCMLAQPCIRHLARPVTAACLQG